MRIYLDDDSASARLLRLLQQGGHDVELPINVGLSGEDDAVHLTQSIIERRALLTGNYRDYENLHNLLIHSGVLVVRKDDDPRRDMTPSQIVLAVEKLLRAGVPIANQFIIVNHWR